MEQIVSFFNEFGPFDWVGLISGIIYVILAARANPLCWIFGNIQCGLLAYADFTSLNLFADGYLQLFYVAMGFWGLYKWIAKKEVETKGNTQSIVFHLLAICSILLLSYFLKPYYISVYPEANLPLLDTTTTLFSIFATYLLVIQDWRNWMYWIVINFVYVGIYFKTGANPYALLYLIFAVVSIYGLYNWKYKIAL